MDPIIEIPVDDVLDRLGHGDRWVKDTWEDRETGRVCLHKGIRLCQPRITDAFLIEEVAAAHGWGIEFNDQPATTFDDIKSVLVVHREISEREMAVTFGPHWECISAVVHRIPEKETVRALDRFVWSEDPQKAADVVANFWDDNVSLGHYHHASSAMSRALGSGGQTDPWSHARGLAMALTHPGLPSALRERFMSGWRELFPETLAIFDKTQERIRG